MKSKIAYIILDQNEKMIINNDYLTDRPIDSSILRLPLEEKEGNCIVVKGYGQGGEDMKLYPSALRVVAYQPENNNTAPQSNTETVENIEEIQEAVEVQESSSTDAEA